MWSLSAASLPTGKNLFLYFRDLIFELLFQFVLRNVSAPASETNSTAKPAKLAAAAQELLTVATPHEAALPWQRTQTWGSATGFFHLPVYVCCFISLFKAGPTLISFSQTHNATSLRVGGPTRGAPEAAQRRPALHVLTAPAHPWNRSDPPPCSITSGTSDPPTETI